MKERMLRKNAVKDCGTTIRHAETPLSVISYPKKGYEHFNDVYKKCKDLIISS